MQLFYNANLSDTSTSIIFDKDESRHIFKVLRFNAGDRLNVTNGQGLMVEAALTIVDVKKAVAEIISTEKIAPLPYHLHLAVAPTKLNDRYEWFLEKATEIGVSEITPIICDHSERKVIKADRYERILQSAMKQSLKAWLPILNPAITLREFLAIRPKEGIKCIAHCENSEKRSLKDVVVPHEPVTILIGPEGDFSSNEIEQAIEHGFTEIHLGTTRLRTETAALVACHSVAFMNQTTT
ncbi:16S rRNA (uracil(1498)-N(3))-methyltransferase [Pukyongia salina]|uniref:Ribosomal RNA small subunit methyltransferase E n=1 Tax=Pukyongia salina TaxID=2094025 RepID=A0A2S0HZ68_9FLAO|nr:16S rRNA (uracil(1498)-N(3))-methyltransferase [Pukyongia salina]AVI51900.1 16S rRNA (uracil(1498)-N(3))-methyltransferase [Pukyongia salina]